MTRSTSFGGASPDSLSGMTEPGLYPTEQERAVRASILGALLGLLLAVIAGSRRRG